GAPAYRSGEAASQANISSPAAPTFGPDGLVLGQGTSVRVTRIAPALPGLAPGDVTIPSESGDELYVFDAGGRHLRTLHALTFEELYTFDYDASGRLTAVHDEAGKTTQIERDAS